jgi:hypothetical protein
MGFRIEREMAAIGERWLQSQGMTVKREFPMPWGICDLVGITFNRAKLQRRLSPLRWKVLEEWEQDDRHPSDLEHGAHQPAADQLHQLVIQGSSI